MTDVAEILAVEFGLTVRAIEANDEGIDRAAQRFRVYADGPLSDPRWYAVKWTSGGSVAGLLAPAALADSGVDGVAGPLRARDGRPWTDQPATVEPRRFSVVPWVGDHQAIEGGLNHPQWRAFGRLLAEVHEFQVPDALRAAIPAVTHDRELAAVTRTDELVASDRPDLDRDVAALWRDNRNRLLAAADAVPQLAAHIDPTVLCHADPHLGNVLAGSPGASDADAVWLVDWDDAVLATPEQDLMFVLGGTYGDEHIGERERDRFAAGYLGDESATADDLRRAADATRLQYYRLVRALIDVADLAAEALVPDTEPAWRATASRLVAANLCPEGLLALSGY